jgi:TatA/E family protein of Tat protein translocase
MGELLVIGMILAILFGPKQIPRLGKALGETIREFRGVGKELQSIHEDFEEEHGSTTRPRDVADRGASRR